MNIFNIAWKEIKRDFRDRRTLFFMLAFPVILMLVLGSALSNTFTTSIPVDSVDVLYQDKSESNTFATFITQVEKSGIHFKQLSSSRDGKKEVELGKADGYVIVSEKGIELFINNGNSIEGNILQGMLTSYVDQYNIASEVVKVAPAKMSEVFTREKPDSYIKETSLQPDKQPGSMDYYAIVITTMIVLYGAMSASSTIVGERVRRTADRLIASPVKKSEIFIGKVLGSLASNITCVLLVVLTSRLLFKANWGEHFGMIFLLLLTEVILAVSIGIGISFLSKTSSAQTVIIMLFVQLSSFFGGAYFRIENPEGIFKFITELSPLTWINTAITKIIYANDFSAAIPAMAINLTGSLVLLLIAVISLQRREGL